MQVFYTEQQTCNAAVGYSPSAAKPALVIKHWLAAGLITENDITQFTPIGPNEISLAHDPVYVNGVLDCRIENGFGNTSQEVAESLPWTTASFLKAAIKAIQSNTHVCSPTSGFHHAGYNWGGGFCTFNGLMITAAYLRKHKLAQTVGILDLDAHYANGTDDIIRRQNADYVTHINFGGDYNRSAKFEDWLQNSIERLSGCDIILYQAGADPHINDPLGGFLTTEQMRLRDRAVFTAFQGKALVWNLAGGYQRDKTGSIAPVLELHRQTMQEAINASKNN